MEGINGCGGEREYERNGRKHKQDPVLTDWWRCWWLVVAVVVAVVGCLYGPEGGRKGSGVAAALDPWWTPGRH